MRRNADFILFNKSDSEFSFRGLGLLALLYFGSLAAAALLSPLFFQLVHYLDPDTSSYLASKPYPEYFDRARLLLVVILFPFLFKLCGLNTRQAIGFRGRPLELGGRWMLYGIAMIVAIYASQLAFGIIEPRDNWTVSRQLEKIGIGLVAGVLVGLIEETLFRGLVFRIFYTAIRPWPALIASSLFFAFLHFKVRDEALQHVPISQIGIDDGFVVALGTITAFATGFNALAFLNLTLVGILAHLTFIRTRNLWAAIGIHAGWVMTIQSISKTFQETSAANLFTGTERIADGFLVTCFLIVFIVLFTALPPSSQVKSGKPHSP